MIDTMTIALFILVLISLATAAVAIGWLSIVSKRLSALGQRVLESDDIGRIIQAADRTSSFESRMTVCESKADDSQKQLPEHEKKLSELVSKQVAVEQMIKKHAVDLAMASEKAASFKLRFDEFENNVGDKLNKLLELEAKVNELFTKLESIEQMANDNGSGLAQANRSIEALTDKIEILQKFRTATERTHTLIQAAFTDIRTSMSPEEGQAITSQAPKPEESSQWPEDVHQEAEDQKTPGTYNLDL
jgi:chromosome segregation ATPase